MVTLDMYSLRTGPRKSERSDDFGIRPYTDKDSETDSGTTAVSDSSSVWRIGTVYVRANESSCWIAEYDSDWSSSGNEENVSEAMN